MSRHGIYYFQWWIPQHLKNDNFSNKFFRLSLRTTIKRDAVKQTHRLLIVLLELEDKFNNNPSSFGHELMTMKNKLTTVDNLTNEIDDYQIRYTRGFNISLQLEGIDIDTDNLGTQEYMSRFTQDELEDFELWKNKQKSAPLPQTTLEQQPHTVITPEANELLSECLELFVTEKQVNWSGAKGSRTEISVRSKISSFIDTIGDKPASQLTKDDSKTFKQLMLKFPKNKNHLKRYRNKSFKDILSMDIPDEDIASDVTRSGYLKQVSSFLGWLFDEDYTTAQGIQKPLQGVFKGGGDASDKVDAFSDEDLKKLFENDYYFRRKHRTASQHWIPLIGLFTGARLNEICQLYVTDIKCKDGIYYFDINQNEDDKHLKKPYHAREVPIHKKLLDLKFIEYVHSVKTKRLFTELKYHETRYYQKTISNWFRVTYKKNCKVGLKKGEKKVFHSFRHTFITYLVNDLEIPQPKIARLVGQKPNDGSTTTGTYAKKPKLEDINKIIQRIKWNVDFSKIRKW